MTILRAFAAQSDRLLAIAFVLFVTFALAGIVSADTAASFTGSSTNPANTLQTLLVQPPASQSATVSAAAGVVNLAWAATPTAPGAGHTLSYDVLRGPVGGPYALVGTTSALTYSDTPPSDGTYEYVIQARVTGGGSFSSASSPARTGLSDRTAPAMSITCNGAACGSGWYTAAVSVTVSGTDTGSGMGSVTRNVDAAGQVSTAGATVTVSVSGDSAGHTVAYFGTDAAGNAASSATQTIRIDGTAPTAVTGLASAQGAKNAPVTVDLTWTAGTDATSGVSGYEVRWTGPVATCPAANTTNYPNFATIGAVTAYQISGLTPNSGYCAYLVTIDNAGNRSAASAVTGATKAK
ncbi:MAG TPA: hypothetical protein VFM06_05445 [Candidatus Limnocylindria bacterium]|nr:hypothetical protein [Candidatus Limnocylindria bacterium]